MDSRLNSSPQSACNQEYVTLLGGRCPEFPSVLRITRPDGLIMMWVRLAWAREIRSHPSGGNCSALQHKETAE